MSGLLIIPSQYFLDLSGHCKDFGGWQINILNYEQGTVLYGEVETLSYEKESDTLSMKYAWAARQKTKGFLVRLSAEELKDTLCVNGLYGASHEDGGCHFESSLSLTAKLLLGPPGSWERSADANQWNEIKHFANTA